MVAMAESTDSISIPHGRPFTVRDLEAFPDDGNRYELLDGMLLVSPAPGFRHQKVVLKLAALLDAVCPDGMHVLPAPFGVQPNESTELQPDVLVTRDEDVTEKNLPVAPLLAVEVLSPSTALIDRNTKKAAYLRMGVPSYWVIDPRKPSLTVFELDRTTFGYEHVADIVGNKAFDATQPFPVRVIPADLLGGLAPERR
ncbi:MAG TPA: Uma2 family endonuclease [Pseudonocardiaceae bacterium]|nr:Uma2 family endonuclease [Pseudonocardiaceae bacterium]